MSVSYLVVETLSEQIATIYEQHQLVSPIKGNKRNLSVAALHAPVRQVNVQHAVLKPASLDSSFATTIRATDFMTYWESNIVESVSLPAYLHSIETLEFIGFDQTRAKALWNNITSQSTSTSELNLNFIGVVMYYLENVQAKDCISANQDWRDTMRCIGMNDHFINGVMHPTGDEVRYTQSLLSWVRAFVRDRYTSLQNLDSHLRTRALELFPDKETQPPPSAITTTRQLAPQSAVYPLYKKGHTALWKATTLHQAQAMIHPDGRINLDAAHSATPGDFHGKLNLCYFTPHHELADQYARWRKINNEIAEMAVVQIFCPDSFVSSIRVECSLFDAGEQREDSIWRKVVHAARRGKWWPEEVAEKLGMADLIQGHVLSCKNCGFMGPDGSAGSWKDVTGSDVVTVRNGEVVTYGIQWAFMNRKACEGFEKACFGLGTVIPLGVFKSPFEAT